MTIRFGLVRVSGARACTRSARGSRAGFSFPRCASTYGVAMTLGCDVRIAARSAVLGLNFTRLGMLPGLGSTHHLPRLVGIGKAMELVLSGATVSAEALAVNGLWITLGGAQDLGLEQGGLDDRDASARVGTYGKY